MTIDIEKLLKDMEAGTQGDWECTDFYGVIQKGSEAYIGYPPKKGAIASLNDGEYIENKNYVADARRIARLPELEREYLAIREAADALADAVDSDNPHNIRHALAAYRKATG